jgi:hypothetical protein
MAHPVSVTISGALMTMPRQASLRPNEQELAVASARFILSAFRAVCESLNPLYGAIQVEAFLPTPAELIGRTARLGTEVFVSDRLVDADRAIVTRLSTAFAEGVSERWATGTFYSGWARFNPERKTVKRPLATGLAAAQALGTALVKWGGLKPSGGGEATLKVNS